jgi:ribosomal protein S14
MTQRCPKCGRPMGKPRSIIEYDVERRLPVSVYVCRECAREWAQGHRVRTKAAQLSLSYA